jgi:ubiquinone/menaquinone biosynthesis C-methylase UbiE
VSDWAAYDAIAGRYDEVWGGRFETVARLVWQRVSPLPGAAILDVGTGTGIVPRALGARAGDFALVGCDRSSGMLRVARARLPSLRLVAADAASLPFRDAVFDVATAGFLFSHLADCAAGLAEVRRLLKPGGALAMTSWAAEEDEPSTAWRLLLASAVAAPELDAALARVAPSVACFDGAPLVESALSRAGFVAVSVQAHVIRARHSLEQFLADRELTPTALCARERLGAEAWARLVARARDEFGRRFGSAFDYAREALIGVAVRP